MGQEGPLAPNRHSDSLIKHVLRQVLAEMHPPLRRKPSWHLSHVERQLQSLQAQDVGFQQSL